MQEITISKLQDFEKYLSSQLRDTISKKETFDEEFSDERDERDERDECINCCEWNDGFINGLMYIIPKILVDYRTIFENELEEEL